MPGSPTRDTPSAQAQDLLFAREMLPEVSRTFAPGIDVLPDGLADPVRLAYLLCRVADTIEDATSMTPGIRREFLHRFGSLLSDLPENGDSIESFAGEVASQLDAESPERRLVAGSPRLLRLLTALDPQRREVIARWTRELSLGMARFVNMEEEKKDGWIALSTCDDLSAYEYYVAGTVGCMLNELFHRHISGDGTPSSEQLRTLAVSFGLGLQGTNIIQDLSDDRDRGWSYLPEEIAERHGTSTNRLHVPDDQAAAMSAIREMAWRAVRDLDKGLEYVLLLPRRHPRIRLFCLWPLLLAVRTLTRLLSSPEVLQRRVRISRPEVRELTRGTIWRCLSNAALRKLYLRERDDLLEVSGPEPIRSQR